MARSKTTPLPDQRIDARPVPHPASRGLRSQGVGAPRRLLALQRSVGNASVARWMNDLGTGASLPFDVRGEMERRLGQDFGEVRVHTGARAAGSATELGAKAYTVGHDIVFNRDRFDPGTPDGRRLLGHELAHVVQQSRGGASPVLDPGASHEAEARTAAGQIAAGGGPVHVSGATGVGLALEPDDELKKSKSSNKFAPIEVPFVEDDPHWVMEIGEQQEYVQTHPVYNREAPHRRQGPYAPIPGSVERHGAQEYHWDEHGHLVKATSTKLTAGVRDRVMYAKKTGLGPGLDYFHVLGIDFGHVDARTREHGGFPGPSSLNRPTGEGVEPLWYNAERQARAAAEELASANQPYLIEVEAPSWKDGQPEKMRIRVLSGNTETYSSGWVPIPPAAPAAPSAPTGNAVSVPKAPATSGGTAASGAKAALAAEKSAASAFLPAPAPAKLSPAAPASLPAFEEPAPGPAGTATKAAPTAGIGAEPHVPNAEVADRRLEARLQSVARVTGAVLQLGGEIVSAGQLLEDALDIDSMLNRGLVSHGRYFTAYQELALQQAQRAESLVESYGRFHDQLADLHSAILGAISDPFEAGLASERLYRWSTDYRRLQVDIILEVANIDRAIAMIPRQKELARQITADPSLAMTHVLATSGSSKSLADLMFFLLEADDIRRALMRASRAFHGVLDTLPGDLGVLDAWYAWLGPR